MILAAASTLEQLREKIANRYQDHLDKIEIFHAPWDDVWYVRRDGLAMSGLHIVKREGLYIFKLGVQW